MKSYYFKSSKLNPEVFKNNKLKLQFQNEKIKSQGFKNQQFKPQPI